MTVNTLVTENIGQAATGDADRLPPLTAGVVIFGLSLLCWAPLLLPVIALFHR
jgi:hypothetical protein